MQHARQLSTGIRTVSPAKQTRDPVIRSQSGRRIKKVKLTLILLTCFLLSLVVVAQYSSLVILNYRLSTARTELSAIQQATKLLEYEVAQLSSIARIEQIAKEELGMVEPEIDQLRVVAASQGEGIRLGE
ncbi:MAG: cell division protein FtsL [Bacillota bacterium]|nr:cell division protein FtsL [Bacillota bacterium]